MQTHPPFAGGSPSLGEDFTVEVVPSQTRTTFFPEQAVVFARGQPEIEIVLLRQEVSLKSQTGTVTAENGNSLEVVFTPKVAVPELVDLAHLRMAFGPSVDMALSILNLAVVQGTHTRDDLLNRLQSLGVQST